MGKKLPTQLLLGLLLAALLAAFMPAAPAQAATASDLVSSAEANCATDQVLSMVLIGYDGHLGWYLVDQECSKPHASGRKVRVARVEQTMARCEAAGKNRANISAFTGTRCYNG